MWINAPQMTRWSIPHSSPRSTRLGRRYAFTPIWAQPAPTSAVIRGGTLFWLDHMSIANVVFLKTLESKFRVLHDSQKNDGAFVLHTKEGDMLVRQCPKTSFQFIYLMDESEGAVILLVQSIHKQFKGYTRKDVENTIEARKLQAGVGHPASKEQLTREVSQYPTQNALFI